MNYILPFIYEKKNKKEEPLPLYVEEVPCKPYTKDEKEETEETEDIS